MRLQSKVLSILAILFVLYLVISFAATRWIFGPVLVRGEQEIARINVKRAVAALRSEMQHLERLTRNWAHSDETYTFVQNLNRRYIIGNLSSATLDENRLDLVLFLDKGGRVVWSHLADLDRNRSLKLPEIPVEQWPTDHPLLSFADLKETHAGIILTRHGPLTISSSPILTGKGYGPRQGTLITGRFLDVGEIELLKRQTQVSFYIKPVDDLTLPAEKFRIENQLADEPRIPEIERLQALREYAGLLAQEVGLGELQFYRDPQAPETFLRAYTTFPDIYGNPALGIEVLIPRFLEYLTRKISLIAFACIAAVSVLLTLSLLIFMRRTVIQPVARLAHRISSIRDSDRLSERCEIDSRDEIGTLARSYNAMLERLQEDTRRRREAEESLRRSEERFRQLAIRDDLTGLYNTRYLYRALKEQFEKCRRNDDPLSLIFIDIDRFKQVVDTHGHLNGSEAIAQVAGTIEACLQEPAFAVAYGGDEYVVVLPGMDKGQAISKAEEIRVRMSGTSYLAGQGLDIRLTSSFGVASYPEDAEDLKGLLAIADRSLFYVKSKGRDGIF